MKQTIILIFAFVLCTINTEKADAYASCSSGYKWLTCSAYPEYGVSPGLMATQGIYIPVGTYGFSGFSSSGDNYSRIYATIECSSTGLCIADMANPTVNLVSQSTSGTFYNESGYLILEAYVAPGSVGSSQIGIWW